MTKRIGEFLIDRGILTPAQVQEILDYSKKNGIKFGEAGLKLQLLAPERLIELFGPGYRTDFIYVTPDRLPQETRTWLPTDLMLAAGALPLGLSEERGLFRTRRYLNLGMINPQRADAVRKVEQMLARDHADAKIKGVKSFLILPDQFVEILASVYQVDETAIRSRGPANVEPILCQFLEMVTSKRAELS